MEPPCEKCIFFRPGRYPRTGLCTRYIAYRGRGKIVHEFADTVRLERSKCGPNGKLFLSKVRDESVFISLLNDEE
ncbi:hypothetical protein EBT25_12085 [bacterium]|jgi:hypothetical protein|nr:hypothetical protein [bacterium]